MLFINDKFRSVHCKFRELVENLEDDVLIYESCETPKEIETMIEFGKIIQQTDAPIIVSDGYGQRVYFLKNEGLVITNIFGVDDEAESRLLASFLNFIESEFIEDNKPVFYVGESFVTGRFFVDGNWIVKTVPIIQNDCIGILRCVNYLNDVICKEAKGTY